MYNKDELKQKFNQLPKEKQEAIQEKVDLWFEKLENAKSDKQLDKAFDELEKLIVVK